MLTPIEPSSTQKSLDPINYQRAIEIANAHIENRQFERVVARFYVGRNEKFDLDAIQKELGAEQVEHSVAFCQKGSNLFRKHVEFAHYELRVTNPKIASSHLTFGKNMFPLTSIQVYNAGNIHYAGILFDCMHARVKLEFFPELERQGFKCWPAPSPIDPSIDEGPFRNVYYLDDEFGPGAT